MMRRRVYVSHSCSLCCTDRSAAHRRSEANVHEPPAQIVAVRRPDAPPDPATGIAAIDRLRSDRDPKGHGRRRDRPARILTPAPTTDPSRNSNSRRRPSPSRRRPSPRAASPNHRRPIRAGPSRRHASRRRRQAAAVKATAVETAAMKAAATAMKLGLGGRRDCRDRRRHPERGNRRNYGLPDRNTHGNNPPAVGPVGRVLSLKLCHDGKSSRVSSQPRAKN